LAFGFVGLLIAIMALFLTKESEMDATQVLSESDISTSQEDFESGVR
jgi:hypothetical protein